MIPSPRQSARVRNPVLLVSGIAWILLLVEPGSGGEHIHHHSSSGGSPEGLLATGPLAPLAASWALMLIAMMAPVLIPHLLHIHLRSFRQRRARSIFLFLAGYAAVWMAAGLVLMAIRQAAQLLGPQDFRPAAALLVVALIWQVSPLKQRSLNRCHANPDLAAFGTSADVDALRFGTTHGLWCAASCWALMLFPMLLPGGHLAAMAIVAFLVFSERIEPPMPPAWRWRGFGRMKRLLVAQARIRFRASGIAPLAN